MRYVFAAVFVGCVVPAGPVHAVALNVADCDALVAERKTLIAAGAELDMKRGAEWAQSNLTAERLREVMRFVRVEELVTFQCADVFAHAVVAGQLKRAEEETRLRVKAAKERKAAERAAALSNVPPLPERNPRRSTGGVEKVKALGDANSGQLIGQALGQPFIAADGPPLPERKPR